MEEWKIIDNFNNYEISNEGNIRHIKSKRIKAKYARNKYGYILSVGLIKDGDTKNEPVYRLMEEVGFEPKN